MDHRSSLLLFAGAVILLISWLPDLLRNLPLSIPIVCVAVGMVAEVSGLLRLDPEVLGQSDVPERVLEAVLVVALIGAGLKIDRPFALRSWSTTWRLLLFAMPCTIFALAALCVAVMSVPWPVALLIGGILAPTDPVLAGDVQVGPPGTGEEGEIRFGLTSEAGLNDGLALPFVVLSLAWLRGEEVGAGQMAMLFVGELIIGIALGVVLGKCFGWLMFRFAGQLSETGDGLIALGMATVAYAATTLAHGNGFVAVFVTALTFRAVDRGHDFHRRMAEFMDSTERLLILLVLVALGALVMGGLLSPLSPRAAAVGMLLLLVVRPVAAWLSLLGSQHPAISRGLTAFFGIRGIGSLYYVVFAIRGEGWRAHGPLTALIAFVVLGSVVLHGLTATPLMRVADRARERTRRSGGLQGDPAR